MRQKEQIPSVGTYTPSDNPWLLKSFSTHKLRHIGKRGSKSLTSEELHAFVPRLKPLVASFDYSVKKKTQGERRKDRFDVLRPEAALEAAKRTNFQSVRLEETPEGLKKSVQWVEKRMLKEEKLSTLKRVMAQFRKGQLFSDPFKPLDP